MRSQRWLAESNTSTATSSSNAMLMTLNATAGFFSLVYGVFLSAIMMTIAIAAQAAWRITKCHEEWYEPTSAMIELALYTVRTPAVTMTSAVMKRIQSVLSFWAISLLFRQLVHDLFENFA